MLLTFRWNVLVAVLLYLGVLHGCSPRFSYKEDAVPEIVNLTPRLQKIFAQTKIVCFGRYAMEVPREAQVVWGGGSFPSRIDMIKGGMDAIMKQMEDDVARMKWEDDTAEVTYSKEGPVNGSWQIRYYTSVFGKELGLHHFKTYVNMDELVFILTATVGDGESEDMTAVRQAARVKSMRLRLADEVPSEPGYCLERVFLRDDSYSTQEMVNAGLYLPSFPDVTFSLSSNKDAYADIPPEEFEKTDRKELSLLARIKKAQEDQGANYPKRTVLREGKRRVQHWQGEESLFRRTDGVHDFEWALVGTPKDIANPSEFNVQMYTKVKHNTVGAAKAASLSDEEAVALWDKLLSGLKFRVKVPRAPEGSYYLPQKAPIRTAGKEE
jgi:hypothetical protein